MKVVLVRHYRVDYPWKFWYNSEEYAAARKGYDAAAIVCPAVGRTGDTRLVCSTLPRAEETARFMFGRDPDHSSDELREVPVRPFIETKVRLPKFVWDVAGRLQWRMNSKVQPESYTRSVRRVDLFIGKILSEGKDVVIVCHGWVIKLMIPLLKAKGFKGPSPIMIRNGVPYEFRL